MDVTEFVQCLHADEHTYFIGVPDSQLRPLCDYLIETRGTSGNHLIAANEGCCAAAAAGTYLATGKVPVVYLQNSGIGNIVNPVVSLLHEKVYGIPCIFVVGWRGEPGRADEPQHLFAGETTLRLLEDLEIPVMVIGRDTKTEEVQERMKLFAPLLEKGRCIAFVVEKDGLTYTQKKEYRNEYTMKREEIIRRITAVSGGDIIVSTTGKTSRELFEIREEAGQPHQYDFLTVGSMGHSSSIALGIALCKKHRKVWCIDGDGALLMHMGAMAVIGAQGPKNLIHVVINNGAHESVGGMPTAALKTDLPQIALGCGYGAAFRVKEYEELEDALVMAKQTDELTFIEVKAAIGARKDLGRPTTTPADNKISFMNYVKELD